MVNKKDITGIEAEARAGAEIGAGVLIAGDGDDHHAVRRRVTRVVPWVTSVTMHVLLVLLGFLIPWGSRMLFSEQTAPQAVIADFNNLALVMSDMPDDVLDPNPDNQQQERAAAEDDNNQEEVIPDLLEEMASSDAALSGPMGMSGNDNNNINEAMKAFTPRSKGLGVAFGGLRGSNARNIVFIVDASGSMLAYLPIIIDELRRSIDQLSEVQNFAVIFFQDDQAIMVPAVGGGETGGGGGGSNQKQRIINPRLQAATGENKRHVYDWMNLDNMNIAARGRSNPIAAIRLALREISPTPDVIFILSTNITGAGEFEVDRDELLKLIKNLNMGKRGELKSVIKTIQFIEEDPLDTLRLIAEENGGPDGYKVLTREELGL